MIYRVRCMTYAGRLCGVVLQQQNGPCPLIAIANVLSLRGHIDIRTPPPDQRPPPPSSSSSSSSSPPPPPCRSSITFPELLDVLSRYLQSSVLSAVVLDHEASAREELVLAASLANFEQVQALLPSLEKGLDVNVVFTHCTKFEYTAEVALFDLCKVRLLHGWVADPRDAALHAALKERSFNEATTFCMSDDASAAEKARVLAFLESSASQLTEAGLAQLLEVVRDDELAVHFRNNHFSVMTKRGGRLLQLVTDEGLVDSAPRVAWMAYQGIHGNDAMLNDHFGDDITGRPTFPAPRQPSPSPPSAYPHSAFQPHAPLPSSYLPAQPPPVWAPQPAHAYVDRDSVYPAVPLHQHPVPAGQWQRGVPVPTQRATTTAHQRRQANDDEDSCCIM